MKRAITIPLPAVRFPDAGWRERLDDYVKAAAREGLDLEVALEPGEKLHGRVGHTHFTPPSDVGVFASDFAGTWKLAPGQPHVVVLVPRDGHGEHGFTSVGAFLDAALVRAWADALHRAAEVEAGDDLDDQPWLDAARALEIKIDPKMHRTRED